MGRPSLFSEELAANICERIAEGERLTDICKTPGMPNRRTVWRWTTENQAFRDELARATEAATHGLVDELVAVCRTASKDSVEATDKRTLTENYRWLAARLLAVYRDRAQVEHSGGVSLNVVTGVPDVTGNDE
jgi:hypothetical protein